MTDNDDRTYIKLHDGMPDHPKVDGLSDKAFRLLVETWCWCSRHLTDGYVPQSTWQKRGTKNTRRELVEAGLVIVRATGGVECHDYLSHQRSAHQVAELREKKKLAAAKGNHERWHVGPKGKPSKSCPYCPRDEDVPAEDPPPDQHEEAGQGQIFDPNPVAGAIAVGNEAEDVTTSAQVPHRSPETEEVLRTSQTETDPLATRGGSGGSGQATAPADEEAPASRKRSAREHGHRIPDDFWPSDDDQRWFRDSCPNLAGQGTDLTHEFKGYWETKPGKDGRKLDWPKTWKTRMRELNRRASPRPTNRGRATTGQTVAAGRDLASRIREQEAEQEHNASIHQLPIRGAS